MEFVSELLRRIGPAHFVFKAILGAFLVDALLLGFILLRRTYRKRYFTRYNARASHFQKSWGDLVSGVNTDDRWCRNTLDRDIVKSLALGALETAKPAEAARVHSFLRGSGLLQRTIHEAEKTRGWRQRQAFIALGRMRAPEGVPALAEGLRDSNIETRLAALRGLGYTGSPEAGKEILQWLGEGRFTVPALPIENALINCCRERPQMLLPYLEAKDAPMREVLARVLGEVGTAALETDLIQIADDPHPELRASAARALGHAKPRIALPVLEKMTEDEVWFVRLRAAVALGELRTSKAIPALIRALTDAHRFVRFRSAQALVEQEEILQPAIFERVVELGDTYATDAYITAAENAGEYGSLLEALRQSPNMDAERRERLLAAASQRIGFGGEKRPEDLPAQTVAQ
jgi:HEAT repeat protein